MANTQDESASRAVAHHKCLQWNGVACVQSSKVICWGVITCLCEDDAMHKPYGTMWYM